MRYYARYDFERCSIYTNSYILTNSIGKAENLHLAKYSESTKHNDAGISGKEYIHLGVPHNPSMTRFFAHTFEGFRGKPITSTEALTLIGNEKRTFGDCFCLGYKDLIFFRFSEDMSVMSMYFIRDMGNSKAQKQAAFKSWCDGDKLEFIK